MRRLALLCLACVLALAASSGSATAFEGGGRSPSAAPLLEWGQHYAGQLNNHEDDANFTSSPNTVAIYKLPPVSTRDVVTVNWHALPFTRDSSSYPVYLMLLQGVDDYSWGTTFYASSSYYRLSGSGTARSEITVQQTDSSATYLAFYSYAGATNPSSLETYPYDFIVEPPRHALTLSVAPVTSVAINGQIHASVSGVTGLPAPDGQTYTLTGTWGRAGAWTGTATSLGGQLGFQLSLPEAALNEWVNFVISRPADSQYQAIQSTSFSAKVTAPPAPPAPSVAKAPKPSSACRKATSAAHALARQRHRLQRRLQYAYGRNKRRLRHKVRFVTRTWHAAQEAADAACP
jgi:hypothetical protein